MNRTIVLLIALFYAALVGCTSKPTPTVEVKPQPSAEATKIVEALKPPEVKKGVPKGVLVEQHDIDSLRKKTKPNAAEWFKMVPGQEPVTNALSARRWYIDWDAERQPFDIIVIHHTADSPSATADSIDEAQKGRLYEPRYRSENNDPYVKELIPQSGHVIDGKERFIGYHHLVYADGKVTTELSPLVKIDNKWYVDHVGWHAGKWSVNCRSVAICLVGDFSDKEPPDAQLRATAGLILHYRTFNAKATVTGHGDHANTECPGKTWRTWRTKMLALADIKD